MIAEDRLVTPQRTEEDEREIEHLRAQVEKLLELVLPEVKGEDAW